MLCQNKKALVIGVANDRSIAWAIAKTLKEAGAQIALSYVNDAIQKRVEPLAESVGADFTFKLDVSEDQDYSKMLETIKKHWGGVDIIVHSVAFAEREDLSRPFYQTSRAGFLKALDISAYSLVAITQTLKPIMHPNASIMAMTYYGSTKVVKNYNVMGVAKAALESTCRYLAYDLGEENIRVNCISAGPIKTLAASGIAGFREMLKQVAEKAPLKTNTQTQDVANMALYLASDLSMNVTGQCLFVDGGLNIYGGF